MEDVFVISAVRTAIGDYGGGLKTEAPSTLGASVIKEAVERANVAPESVGHVVFGNVIHTEPRDMYLSRFAAIQAGLHEHTPAMTLNRLCGSGLQAVLSAAEYVANGDAEIAVGGGAESMSRALYSSALTRWGQRMGDTQLYDMMIGALTDPFGNGHMGITAENVADRYRVSREEQDEFAADSHRKAAQAVRQGRFDTQIMPVTVRKGREESVFSVDEHIRPDLDATALAQLRPVFKKEQGTVTAGNSSPINDGAAAVVLGNERAAAAAGKEPLGRLVAFAHAGVDPAFMGIGPVPAVTKVLNKAGLRADDISVIESNEAFAAQACVVTRELRFDPTRVNPNGGAIALGHPIGATGAILVTKLLYELKRIKGRYGLVTMCIGGGQGIAALFESV
ncbi:beta-ketothiolase BktB [Paraburkholderia sp. ZP32-5]|uniref:beta-ketothiolase BktB n=1 Tax=Paraburkholderia sp. ZP32-5 TaxID=2883245 RepID=UPI001F34256D|nr:beta-ketothiolase BktB [Paraburkholderia sp. ZP32-5]